MNQHYFITGTDTGVGKTHVTAALLRELRRQGIKAAAFKPIACGPGGRDDAKIYRRLMHNEVPLDLLNPVYLKQPLAPVVAAKMEHREISLHNIRTAYRSLSAEYQVVLVEGAGGLMVPIKRDYYIADLAKDLELPVLIVSRLSLGTINHSVLTVRAAQSAGLRVAGIILNDTLGRTGLAERTNVTAVPATCGVPLLGVVAHKAQPDVRKIVVKCWR
ncbi:MAG: ATP-dependent dethiobiotin synthetase BioD 1 [Verrucomicrobiae bacterium]|nr:ATP-dependent dethiobiotin synthetase BioD 1 [Verrucomicrobiae bacterium]